ncbi:craniofacial development protein 2-like [Schistocerca cancellata]|uniref:craniofacial development protein 2-like n=1 Tax=Schistocerca cancellata TaxID=274614 RepID=UPI002119256A|nr:craniofacial development protein 2-like [Schistocerca cancellata]
MDSFYEALSDVVVRVKDKDSVLLMGDFNARIGNRTEGYEKVMGKFGEDMEANRNGKQLLDFCASMGLVITNSFFKHKNIHRYTWEGRGTRSVIDYIITDQEFRKAVRDTRVFRGFFDDTDHYLICSEIGIVRPKVQEFISHITNYYVTSKTAPKLAKKHQNWQKSTVMGKKQHKNCFSVTYHVDTPGQYIAKEL